MRGDLTQRKSALSVLIVCRVCLLCRADMTQAPVGEWESPITSELITSSSIRLGNARPGKDGYVYWLEARPSEGGRSVLVRQ